MPLFDIQCRKCERIHEIVAEWQDEAVVFNCSNCNNKYHDMLAPLCAMQPDNMWSGVTNQHGNFTSKSYYKRYLKQRNLERVDNSIIEEVSKKQRARKDPKNLEEKISKRVTKYLEKEVIPSI